MTVQARDTVLAAIDDLTNAVRRLRSVEAEVDGGHGIRRGIIRIVIDNVTIYAKFLKVIAEKM